MGAFAPQNFKKRSFSASALCAIPTVASFEDRDGTTWYGEQILERGTPPVLVGKQPDVRAGMTVSPATEQTLGSEMQADDGRAAGHPHARQQASKPWSNCNSVLTD